LRTTQLTTDDLIGVAGGSFPHQLDQGLR